MFYKVVKNKIRFYEVEIDKKIEKIKEEIIKKHGKKEHRNIIASGAFNPIEKNSKIINFTYKNRGLFLIYEYDYDIIYYPEIVLLVNQIIASNDYKSIKKLNKYQAPLNIRKMDEGRYKKNILKRDYPYDKYIKEIKSCFKAKVIEEIEFVNEVDMLTKLIEHDIKNKKQLKQIRNLIKNNNEQYQDLIEEVELCTEGIWFIY